MRQEAPQSTQTDLQSWIDLFQLRQWNLVKAEALGAEFEKQGVYTWPWSRAAKRKHLRIEVGPDGDLAERHEWGEPQSVSADHADGLAPGEVLLRQEEALMMTGAAVGGTLTLTNQRLVWCRSRWSSFAFVDWGKPLLHAELQSLSCNRGGRELPGWDIALSLVGLTPFGIGAAIITGRFGILIGLFNWIGLFLVGAYRKTLAVRFEDSDYYFVVRDLDGWLTDLGGGSAH